MLSRIAASLARQPLAIVALLLALGGTSYAAHTTHLATSPTSTITGCVSKSTGVLRVVERAKQCTHKETKISFNTQGPVGAAGASGPAGTSGADGTSVSVATEPAGANCSTGGSRLSVGSGPPEYVCNGPEASNYYTKSQAGSQFAAATLFAGSALADLNSASDADSLHVGCYLGTVLLTSAVTVPDNWTSADGQALSISSHTTLFSVMGTNFGGNGTTTFDLPNLNASAPRSTDGQSTRYYICVSGNYPT